MSTAWYKPNSVPQKIRSWTSKMGTQTNDSQIFRSIEIWETTCVVTNMNSGDKGGVRGGSAKDADRGCRTPFSVLINPGNPSLSGVSNFSYFPVGGPEPPPSFTIGKDSHPIMGFVTQWGGMEVGNGMFFAANTVDGIVHQYGGKKLKRECENALSSTWTGGTNNIDVGMAISTPAVGPELREASGYDILVHTVPPFVNQDYRFEARITDTSGETTDDNEGINDHNNFLLAECYRNSLRKAAAVSPSSPHLKIVCPLLGAGCRGFPTERAIQIAAEATTRWMTEVGMVEDSMIGNIENTSANGENKKSLFSFWTGWFGGRMERSRQSGVCEGVDDNSHQSTTLAFGIPDGEIRRQLIKAIDREMEAQML